MHLYGYKKIEKKFVIDHSELGPIKIETDIIDAASVYLIAKRQTSDHYSYYSSNLARCTSLIKNATLFYSKEKADERLEQLKTTRTNFKAFIVSSLDNHFVNDWQVNEIGYQDDSYGLRVYNSLVYIEDFKDYNKNRTNYAYWNKGKARTIEQAIESHIENMKKNIVFYKDRLNTLEKDKLEYLKQIELLEKRTEKIDMPEELEQLSKEYTHNREDVVRMLHGKV